MLNQNRFFYDPRQKYERLYGISPPKDWDHRDPAWRKKSLLETRHHAEGCFFGYITRWNSPAVDRPGVMIAPNAFSDFLKTNAECACVTNHKIGDGVLGWRSDGSLFLEEDCNGLYFELRCPNDTPVREKLWNATLKFNTLGTSFDYVKQDETYHGRVSYYTKCALREVSILTDTEHGAIPGARAWYRKIGESESKARSKFTRKIFF